VKYVLVALVFLQMNILTAGAIMTEEDTPMMVGMPIGIGGSEEADLELCPQGARVVYSFLEAWSHEDYKAMYSLIDDESRADYSLREAELDFSFMEFKEYQISSVRQDGDNYEFIISSGSWKYGNKDIKKMIISGRTYKIIMPLRGTVFKKSAESYF